MTDNRADAIRHYTLLAVTSIKALEEGDTRPRDQLCAEHPAGAFMLLVGTETLLSVAINVISQLADMSRPEVISALAQTTTTTINSSEFTTAAVIEEYESEFNEGGADE